MAALHRFHFFIVTTAPAILLTIYTDTIWFMGFLLLPILWILSPRALGQRLPDSLSPPMSGQRLPYAILLAIAILGFVNLSGIEYMGSMKALIVIVLLTIGILIFISLMARLPRSKAEKFFDWLD